MESKEQSPAVEFDPPKGANIPETAANGKEFDTVCSFKLIDGRLCMTKFGDAAMPGGGAEKEKPAEQAAPDPHYSDFAKGMSADGGQAEAQS